MLGEDVESMLDNHHHLPKSLRCREENTKPSVVPREVLRRHVADWKEVISGHRFFDVDLYFLKDIVFTGKNFAANP